MFFNLWKYFFLHKEIISCRVDVSIKAKFSPPLCENGWLVIYYSIFLELVPSSTRFVKKGIQHYKLSVFMMFWKNSTTRSFVPFVALAHWRQVFSQNWCHCSRCQLKLVKKYCVVFLVFITRFAQKYARDVTRTTLN